MNEKQRFARQRELERAGLYDVDMNEQHRTFDAMDIDDGFNYLLTTPVEKVRRAIVLSVVAAVGPVLTWFGLGSRVEGRENLRALKGKGAICACTHTHHLDTLLIKNALGAFRVFHTGSYYLLKRGELGRIFKAGGFLPVGTTFKDMRNLQNAVGTLVGQGKIVNFYPEHALWPRYEKLRPFKPGAFHCAVKFGVPVLPVFLEFRQTKLRKLLHLKKKVVVHILPAMYPPEEGSDRDRARALSAAVFEAMRKKGTELYGVDVKAPEPEGAPAEVPAPVAAPEGVHEGTPAEAAAAETAPRGREAETLE